MNKRFSIVFFIALLALELSACGNHVWYYVRRGDTLYSVSFRYGQDYKQVAQWNHIAAPYVITPGQRLRVSPPLQSGFAPQSSVAASADNADDFAQGDKTESDQRVSSTDAQRPAVRSGRTQITTYDYPDNIVWHWPVNGKVIQSYSAQQPGLKGIDIGGYRGMPVRAAANGRVVYAGQGLASYGRLIIIKHNEKFLSAYAYNQKLLVSEGQKVEAGSVIAEMGDSGTGTDQVKLHFEVRRSGRPVNPLKYLPRR